MMNVSKYKKQYYLPPETCMDWAKKDYIDKAPAWCSVDLRDGNQACRCNAMNRLERREAKKRKCVMVEMTKELEETIPDETFQKTSEGELTVYIQDYLRSLPSDKRILFVRRYWYGDSIKELAVMFCMTQSSVKVSLFRMREQFKEMLVCQGVIESH